MSRCVVQDVVDSDSHVEFSVVFEIYNYFPVRFNYDRGSFGFSIDQGERGVSITPVDGCWPPFSELALVLRYLDRQIRSRIPYGFLESHGWAEPVASEIVLDPDLVAFAAQAGYRPHHDITSLTLADAGGRDQIHDRSGSGWIPPHPGGTGGGAGRAPVGGDTRLRGPGR